jgi:hypothetical protein
MGYNLLLGYPWLLKVKGIISGFDRTVTTFDKVTEKQTVLNTGQIEPPNFQVMFDGPGRAPGKAHGRTPEEGDSTSFDESKMMKGESDEAGNKYEGGSDDEGESDDDGDSVEERESIQPSRRKCGRYTYLEVIKLYSRLTTVFCRNTTLFLEVEDEERNKILEVGKAKYISPHDYGILYGKEGGYSHLAQAIDAFVLSMIDEHGNDTEGDYDMLVIDHEDRASMTGRTSNAGGTSAPYTVYTPGTEIEDHIPKATMCF